MKPTVYLETSVVSYYTSRPSRDIIVLAHQQITAEWWAKVPRKYEIVISEVVIEETSAGDKTAAERRLEVLKGFAVLKMRIEVEELARRYLKVLPIPEKAFGDVLHLAFCSIYKVDFLVTWNCNHLANAEVIRVLQKWNRENNIHTPIICTPDVFLED